MAGKRVAAGDKHIGRRIRMRRMMLGLSQTAISDKLGLTFQQVQKYENGSNRVSGARLQTIAEILQCPVSFFFEGMEGGKPALAVTDDFTTTFLADRQGLALARAFVGIESPAVRCALVAMAEAAAAKKLAKVA